MNGRQIGVSAGDATLEANWVAWACDVDLSLDGPKHLHDHFRKSKHGESSFDHILRLALVDGAHCFLDNGMSWQIHVLVSG
jgi:sulfatase maturation enzyme AslB (radical SAM superfamily)